MFSGIILVTPYMREPLTQGENILAEAIRMDLAAEINSSPGDRATLEKRHGQVWDSDELRRDFEVIAFGAPLVVVKRRSDGAKGSLIFQHHPRYYWGWDEHKE